MTLSFGKAKWKFLWLNLRKRSRKRWESCCALSDSIHKRILRRFFRYRIVIAIIIVSTVGFSVWCANNYGTWLTSNNFAMISSLISVLGVCVITFAIATLPTEVEKEIKDVFDKQSLPLETVDDVYEAAVKLLTEANNSTVSDVQYTSSTPFFGLYKCRNGNDPVASEWYQQISKRIQMSIDHAAVTTAITCLMWEPYTKGRAPLYSVCRRLCNNDIEKSNTIYRYAMRHWSMFQDLLKGVGRPLQEPSDYNNINVYISRTVPDIFAFYSNVDGIENCVIGVAHYLQPFSMSGFCSGDSRWVNIAKEIIASTTNSYHDIMKLLLADMRTPKQKERDIELLTHFCATSHSPRQTLQSLERYPRFNIQFQEFKYVFPFTKGKPSCEFWANAIDLALNSCGGKDIIGLDINTRCGILAIHLAGSGKCSKVYGTESDSKAMGNALMNVNRYSDDLAQGRISNGVKINDKLYFYCANGINLKCDDGSRGDDAIIPFDATANTCVITYSNYFYVSYFNSMNYLFSYKTKEDNTKATANIKSNLNDNSAFGNNYAEDFMGKVSFESTVSSLVSSINMDLFLITPYSKDLMDWHPGDILKKHGFTFIRNFGETEGECVMLYNRLKNNTVEL